MPYIRKTKKEDLLSVLSIYRDAMKYMKENHNPNQWYDFGSLRSHVSRDVDSKISYVLIDQGEIKACFSLLETPEPTYGKIEGRWMDDSSYFTIHRLAVKEHDKGYASSCIRYAFLQNRHIRIDTHRDNLPMQNLLRKMGFASTGVIHVEDGSPRLAFEKVYTIHDFLLDWYRENKRDLPWRDSPTPYHVWLSEIMLQQTRVETVKGYYQRFLAALPTIESLATCKEDVYIKLWQGLGYYSRVRHLHEGAVKIMREYEGSLPREKKELLSIPGIGEYTSNAVLSIAYQKPYVAVDGNLLRVFARLNEENRDIHLDAVKQDCDRFFHQELGENPGEINQALMDLGEMVCLPHGAPKCDICPLRQFCLCFRDQCQDRYPVSVRKDKKKNVDMTVFLISYQDRYLIRKRPSKGLLASLYEFINVDRKIALKEAEEYLSSLGFAIGGIRKSVSGKHIFTHLIWNMTGYEVILSQERTLPSSFFAGKEELRNEYPIPSAFKIYLNEILNQS